MDKKQKKKSALAAVLVLCVICTCFLDFGRTSAYVSDISNTVVNTFSGEDVTEPTSEQTAQEETQESETAATYVNTSPISPNTGSSGAAAFSGLIAALLVSGGLSATVFAGKNKKT